MRTALSLILLAGCLTACGGGSSKKDDDSSAPPVALCQSATGLRAPLPACSPDTVCTRVASELAVASIDTSTIVPSCDVSVWDERLTRDVLGFTRHACIVRPAGTSAASPRPLLLWFHPGGAGSADLAATETDLVNKAKAFDLSGDPARPGFILVSVQGRNLRFPTAAPRDGQHHDFYYRDLNVPSSNPDIANVDSLIDELVAQGIVDLDRIYVSGWSNGGFFSQLYAIARHSTPTAGGNRVAAAAVFAAASPFGDVSWDPFNEVANDGSSSCETTLAASTVPIQVVYRASDAAVACDAVQAMCFSTEPGYTVDQWIPQASAFGIQLTGLPLGGLESGAAVAIDATAPGCTDYSGGCPVGDCGTVPFGDTCLSIVNHARWPDGVYNNPPVGSDRELDMLGFLKTHPL